MCLKEVGEGDLALLDHAKEINVLITQEVDAKRLCELRERLLAKEGRSLAADKVIIGVKDIWEAARLAFPQHPDHHAYATATTSGSDRRG